MQIIKGTTEFELDGNYAIAIGKFDGIHLGHQRLIEKIKSFEADGYKSSIFTFDPSPAAFFGDGSYKGLTTRDEKRRIFAKLGMDVLFEYPLNMKNASIEPEAFIEEFLVRKMHAKCVICGPDLTFGNKGAGNVEMLRAYGVKCGFEVHVCEKVKSGGVEIGSSLIRKEVEEGLMEKVCEHIGAPYSVTGIVAKGNQIGRTIGLPTVNLIPEPDKLLPPFGVYKAVVSYKGNHYKGITNIGIKPTVTDVKQITVETNILDFNEDIYGEPIIVNLMTFMRPERKFNSTEELRQQIESDIRRAYEE